MSPSLIDEQESQIDNYFNNDFDEALLDSELQSSPLSQGFEVDKHNKGEYQDGAHNEQQEPDAVAPKHDSVPACVEETQYVAIEPETQLADESDSSVYSPQPDLRYINTRRNFNHGGGYEPPSPNFIKRPQESFEVSDLGFKFPPAPRPKVGQYSLSRKGDTITESGTPSVRFVKTKSPVAFDQQRPQKEELPIDVAKEPLLREPSTVVPSVSETIRSPALTATVVSTTDITETVIQQAAALQATLTTASKAQIAILVQKSLNMQKGRSRTTREPFPEVSRVPSRRTSGPELLPARDRSELRTQAHILSDRSNVHLPRPLPQVVNINSRINVKGKEHESSKAQENIARDSKGNAHWQQTTQTPHSSQRSMPFHARAISPGGQPHTTDEFINVKRNEEAHHEPKTDPDSSLAPIGGRSMPPLSPNDSSTHDLFQAVNQHYTQSGQTPRQDVPRGSTRCISQSGPMSRPLRGKVLVAKGVLEDILHNVAGSCKVDKSIATPGFITTGSSAGSVATNDGVIVQRAAISQNLRHLLDHAAQIEGTLESYSGLEALAQSRSKEIERLKLSEIAYAERIASLEFSEEQLRSKVDRLKQVAVGYQKHANDVVTSQNHLMNELAKIKSKAAELENDKRAVDDNFSRAESRRQEAANLVQEARRLFASAAEFDKLSRERDIYRDKADDAAKEIVRRKVAIKAAVNEKASLVESMRMLSEHIENSRGELTAARSKCRALQSELVGSRIQLAYGTQAKRELQKQLEAKSAAHADLVDLFRTTSSGVLSRLSKQDGVLGQVLNSGVATQAMFQEIAILINTMKNVEPMVPHALSDLVEGFYKRIEINLQDTNAKTKFLQHSEAQLVKKVQACLEQIHGDAEARNNLSNLIVELQSANAALVAEKALNDCQLANLSNENKVLQTSILESRNQLSAKVDELRESLAAPRDDPQLQVKLQLLQNSLNSLREQLQAAKQEIVQANAEKTCARDGAFLAQAELQEMVNKLNDAQLVIKTLKVENENYLASAKIEGEKVRQEVAKAASASKAELEIRHKGLVKTLEQRRKEAEDELITVSENLHRIEQETANSSASIATLQQVFNNQCLQFQDQETSIQRLEEQILDSSQASNLKYDLQQALQELTELREQFKTSKIHSRQTSEDALRVQKDLESELQVFDALEKEKESLLAEKVDLVKARNSLELEKSKLEKVVECSRHSLSAENDNLQKIKSLEEEKELLELTNRVLQEKIDQAARWRGHDKLQHGQFQEHGAVRDRPHQMHGSPGFNNQAYPSDTHSSLSWRGVAKPSPLRNAINNGEDRILGSYPEDIVATQFSNSDSSPQGIYVQSPQASVARASALSPALRTSGGTGHHQLLLDQGQILKRTETRRYSFQSSTAMNNGLAPNLSSEVQSKPQTSGAIQPHSSMPPVVDVDSSSPLSEFCYEQVYGEGEIGDTSKTADLDAHCDVLDLYAGSHRDKTSNATASVTKTTEVTVTHERFDGQAHPQVKTRTPRSAPTAEEEAARHRASKPLKSAMKSASDGAKSSGHSEQPTPTVTSFQKLNSILKEKASGSGVNKHTLGGRPKSARVGSSYNRVASGRSVKTTNTNGAPNEISATQPRKAALLQVQGKKKSPATDMPRGNLSGSKRLAVSPIPTQKPAKAPRISLTHTSNSKSKMVVPDSRGKESQDGEYFPGSSALHSEYWGR